MNSRFRNLYEGINNFPDGDRQQGTSTRIVPTADDFAELEHPQRESNFQHASSQGHFGGQSYSRGQSHSQSQSQSHSQHIVPTADDFAKLQRVQRESQFQHAAAQGYFSGQSHPQSQSYSRGQSHPQSQSHSQQIVPTADDFAKLRRAQRESQFQHAAAQGHFGGQSHSQSQRTSKKK